VDTSKIRPLAKRILVKRCEAAQKIGAILLPEGAKEKPKEGEIVAIGPEQKGLKVGERVLFGAYAGVQVSSDEGDFLVMSEEDILAVVEHV